MIETKKNSNSEIFDKNKKETLGTKEGPEIELNSEPGKFYKIT